MFNPTVDLMKCPSEFHSIYNGKWENEEGLFLPIGKIQRKHGKFIFEGDDGSLYLGGNGLYKIFASVVFENNRVGEYVYYAEGDNHYEIITAESDEISDSCEYSNLKLDFTIGVWKPHIAKLNFFLKGADIVVNHDVNIVKI